MTISYFTMYVIIPIIAAIMCATINVEFKKDSRTPTLDNSSRYTIISNIILVWCIIMALISIHANFMISILTP